MAEKGSAGQVGGLEASKEVRERLALESRRWKCSQCAKSNQEIMDEWWEACRAQGVNIEESTALESLPEGMNVEARDPNAHSADGKGKQTDIPEARQATTDISDPSMTQTPNPIPSVSSSPPLPQQQQSSPYLPRPDTAHITHADFSSPTASQVQLSSESRLTPAEAESATLAAQSRPVQLLHRPPIPAPDPPQREAMSLDTAIGAIIFLLAAMIVKKVFYPAQSPMDDFYMND